MSFSCIRESAAEETRFLSREEYERILPVQDDTGLLSLIRRIADQVSKRFSRTFGSGFSGLDIASYSDPGARAVVDKFGRIPADAFVLGDKILVNLASNEVQRTIQDVIVHELSHKLYDIRRGDLSVDIDDEDFADVLVKGFSRDPAHPFNLSTAPKQYRLFRQIMADLTEGRMVTAYLDKIASGLESRGLVKEAERIDIVSNTIEKTTFKFPGFGRSNKDELQSLIGDRVKKNPGFLANKIEIYDRSRGHSDEGRVRTRTAPKEFRDKFVQGPDGFWYLQDVDALSIQQYPDKMVLYDDSRDRGVEIEGLEIIDPTKEKYSLTQPLRSRRDYGRLE